MIVLLIGGCFYLIDPNFLHWVGVRRLGVNCPISPVPARADTQNVALWPRYAVYSAQI